MKAAQGEQILRVITNQEWGILSKLAFLAKTGLGKSKTGQDQGPGPVDQSLLKERVSVSEVDSTAQAERLTPGHGVRRHRANTGGSQERIPGPPDPSLIVPLTPIAS